MTRLPTLAKETIAGTGKPGFSDGTAVISQLSSSTAKQPLSVEEGTVVFERNSGGRREVDFHVGMSFCKGSGDTEKKLNVERIKGFKRLLKVTCFCVCNCGFTMFPYPDGWILVLRFANGAGAGYSESHSVCSRCWQSSYPCSTLGWHKKVLGDNLSAKTAALPPPKG